MFFFEGPAGLEIPTIQLRNTWKPSCLKPFEENSGRLKLGEQIRRIINYGCLVSESWLANTKSSFKTWFCGCVGFEPLLSKPDLWFSALVFMGVGWIYVRWTTKKVEGVFVRIHWRRPGRTFRSYAFSMHVYCLFLLFFIDLYILFFFERPGGLEIPTIQPQNTSKPSFRKNAGSPMCWV